MPRKPRSPEQVSSSLVAVRLTEKEKARLDSLVDAANRMLRFNGLPEAVSASSLLRSLIDRAAAEAGLISQDTVSPAKAWTKPIDLQVSRVSPKGTTALALPPTRFERILASFEQEAESEEGEKNDSASTTSP